MMVGGDSSGSVQASNRQKRMHCWTRMTRRRTTVDDAYCYAAYDAAYDAARCPDGDKKFAEGQKQVCCLI